MAKRRANGEGNLRKRSDGRWEGRYTAGYDPDTGKRIIKNVLGKTQAEAKEKLKAAVEQAQQVDVARTDEYTVASWLHTWYDLYALPNVRQATADRYKLMIETYTIPRIGKIKLKKLTSRDLQKMYKNLMEHGRVNMRSGHGNPGLSSTTVHSVHLMLHSAFERAVKERLIARKLHQKILKDAGLEHISFHALRHTFATLALQNGIDIKTVSNMLGHYDAGFTLRTYTHATRQVQDQAAETMGSFMAQMM